MSTGFFNDYHMSEKELDLLIVLSNCRNSISS